MGVPVPCKCQPPPGPPPPPNTHYKFKRFGVLAFPDKKFPVEAVPSLATRQLLYRWSMRGQNSDEDEGIQVVVDLRLK